MKLSLLMISMFSVGRICAFSTRSSIGCASRIAGVKISQSRIMLPSIASTRLFMSSTSSRSSPVVANEVTKKRTPKTTDSDIKNNDNKSSQQQQQQHPPMMNLYTISKEELGDIVQLWGYPRYRANQIYHWIRERGVVDVAQMDNIPKKLRRDLQQFSSSAGGTGTTDQSNSGGENAIATTADTDGINSNSKASTGGALELVREQVSPKDGTIKRLYRLRDGYLIESVLMPYQDGRWTSCISSQAGCAQGCVFCATGQMGFQRQLTADEIVEQVTRFATHLRSAPPTESEEAKAKATRGGEQPQPQHNKQQRLSNIVFMGEGEPLANFRNVMEAVPRIQDLAGIGARKITISTVGVVPNIRKLMASPIQVRLAVSLHCASDEERSALLPANRRYGGLNELMTTLYQYIETTGRRLTLEWALIEGENDTPETAYKLGKLLRKYKLRRDMVHINVIPLNPTGGFSGSASGKQRVDEFCRILEEEFGVVCTPRVRRGIDIDAGCGQLKAKALFEEEEELKANLAKSEVAEVEVVEQPIVVDEVAVETHEGEPEQEDTFSFDFATTVDLDSEDVQYNEDGEIVDETFDSDEASRILTMFKA